MTRTLLHVRYVPGTVEELSRNRRPGLLRPEVCLTQADFRPAETHRNPGGDQFQHELAGVTTIIRRVIGKLDADAPLFCHDPHIKWRHTFGKTVPVYRQPVPFGEVGGTLPNCSTWQRLVGSGKQA